MREYIFFLFVFVPFLSFSQEKIILNSHDNKYLEDQLYICVYYNALLNLPKQVHQRGLSIGGNIGFIRDIPFNKNRNKGLGIGLGYVFNNYNQNMNYNQYYSIENSLEFEIEASNNRYNTQGIEFPIEYRWRTSTPSQFNFWRIYSGIKFSYLFSKKLKYNLNEDTVISKNKDYFESFQYGVYTSAGFSTWNLYLYYGINPIYKKSTFNGSQFSPRDLRIGLIFFVL